MPDLSQSLATALVGRYAIERELGRGGMATVFLAEDVQHHRKVAIKVLHSELAAVIGSSRFLREIDTLARLTHPNIVPLFDSGAAAGLVYFVMPYVEGESLRARLAREKQLPVADAVRITAEIADALDYAHEHGIVHRDLKPENVLLQHGRAMLTDFGVARAVAVSGDAKLTTTGFTVGTPPYMSPEQLAGGAVDARSDVYGLGCVAYEMLAGQPPFTGPTAESVTYQHLNAPPPEVTRLRPAAGAAVASALSQSLAKTPADRFTTAGALAAALAATTGAPAEPQPKRADEPAARPRAHRTRQLALAAALTIVALVAVAAWQRWGPFGTWLGDRHAARPAMKDWILVAEFEGPADDSTLATAARSLVSAALDQSEILATVPRDQIQLALQQAGKPTDTRVSADVARELAYRRAVRAVLEGEIERIGKAYSVVLRVVDAESLKVVVTERGSAKNEDALVPALGRLAEKLRRELGERRSAIAATRPLTAATTASFEAYRLYVEAQRAMNSADFEGAIALCYEALRLDPGFVAPWSTIGLAHGDMGRADSALAAYDQAARHPERMTAAGRFALEAYRADEAGDRERALAAWSRYLQISPGRPGALNNYAALLDGLGRFEEALARYQEAERLSPFGPSSILLSNQVECLLSLGRVDQARELARRVWGFNGPGRRTEVELAACNWAAAESLATAQTQDPRVSFSRHVGAFNRLAQAQAGRGALRSAEAALLQSARVAQGASLRLQQVEAGRALLFLVGETEGAIALPPDSWAGDSSTATLLFRGLRAATSGDVASAQRLLQVIRGRPARETQGQGASPALLEARVAALAGRWEEVVRILQPIGAQSAEIGWYGPLLYVSGLPAARCLLADAFEKLGQRDSAATYLERMTTDRPAWRYWGGIAQSLAHRRLILLYARTGRLADAERHLAILERWWDRPDDIARRMLDEARSAFRAARGMAGAEGRGT
jgi:tetratricopeptide (TPR) repeat protein/tRNA A-37 threonylcarbamoyl transferase component Bud32